METSRGYCPFSLLSLVVAGFLLACVPAACGEWNPVSGDFVEKDGRLVATTKTIMEIPMAADHLITVRGKTGNARSRCGWLVAMDSRH